MSWQWWQKNKKEPSPVNMETKGPEFKVVVADFYDNISSLGAINLAKALNNCEGLAASSYTQSFDHSFLNLENRNIFELIETGNAILSETKSDVLVWGYREKQRLRLNFQNLKQYSGGDNSFVSVMDSFYLPASFLDDEEGVMPAELILLLYGAVVSTINNPSRQYRIYKKYLLKKITHRLSQIDSASSLGLEYLPYVLNFLGIIYLSMAYDSKYDTDFKIVRDLFENALKYQDKIINSTYIGCIHYHLGQLFDCATKYMENRPSSYYRGAIRHYQTAQKHLSKYAYPYDYGYVCCKLSDLYVNYWKQTEDLQALRDAVFQLREAEKIYTQALFPDFWGMIEERLGYLLHNLGFLTDSAELSNMAIIAYQNRQKIVTEKNDPLLWAEIQEKIGSIHYQIGRNKSDVSTLEEALSCFHDALYIYENNGASAKIKQIKFDISKTYRLIEELKEIPD
ncbi:MAG: hypothetical protein IJ689_04325 [Alphaproteobacteria bacterium]|nr:hypothetical protein [Alphaproteobacteria bacterium]